MFSQKVSAKWHSLDKFWLLFLILLSFTLIFMSVNLTHYPAISGWDEGIYLQFAKNLVKHGEYATLDNGNFQRLFPVPATGPTVIIPIALAFKIFGINLAVARWTVILFLWLTLFGIVLYTFSCYGGKWAAMASIPLFVIAGCKQYDTLWLGRQVLGEIPALSFFFLALWTWVKSWYLSKKWLLASSIFAALVVITKNQMIFILLPGYFILAVFDRIYYHKLTSGYFLYPAIGAILGYGFNLACSLLIVGPSNYSNYLDSLNASSRSMFLCLNLERFKENLRLLYHSGQWLEALLGITYGVWVSRERSLLSIKRIILPIFAVVSFLFFFFLAFLGLVIYTLLCF